VPQPRAVVELRALPYISRMFRRRLINGGHIIGLAIVAKDLKEF
jgi:hypothetical protein